jgi:WD40 repeat protein
MTPASQHRTLLRAAADRFDADWQNETPPLIEDYFSAFLARTGQDLDAPARAEVLRELIKIDLEYRWKGRAEPWLLDDYAVRLPELGGPATWPVDLIAEEYRARQRWGSQPPEWDFLARFPGREAEVETALRAVDQSLTGPSTKQPRGAPTIPGYEVLDELGRGGMGVVYRARQLRLRRVVALKTIRAADASPELRGRFQAEAAAVAHLQHPNIVQTFEAGEHEGLLYFSMELVNGSSLAAVLHGEPAPPAEAAELLETLARAVDFAHQAGVVHRDLKPANILLSQEGGSTALTPTPQLSSWIPKLADFGLAKRLDLSEKMTHTGQLLGTPSYMAPEQAHGLKDAVGPAADIWALGVILYEMLTGRPPFKGANVLETLEQVRTGDPVPPSRLQPRTPRDLETICLKCLHKEPAKRYPRALDLADDLQRFRDGRPILARPVGRAERLLKWVRKNPVLAALTVVIAITLALAAGMTVAFLDNAELQRLNAIIGESLKETELQRGQAVAAREEAVEQRGQAEAARKARYQQQHVVATDLVPRLWREGYHFRLPELLAGLVPQKGEDDLRGFEWHYWRRVTHDLRLVAGHTDTIYTLAVAPSGDLVASAGRDHSIKLWDLATGRAVRTLGGHQLPVTSVAFSPDGKHLASVAFDFDRPSSGTELKVWEVGTGQVLASARPRGSLLVAVAYSPDGRRLATGGSQSSLFGTVGEIKIWDPTTCRVERSLNRRAPLIGCVAFSPDGAWLASGTQAGPNGPGEVRLWSTSTWQTPKELGSSHPGLCSLTFTSDGQELVTTGFEGRVRIWDVPNNTEKRKLEGHSHVVCSAALSRDGKRLATASFDGTAKLWRLDSGKELMTLRGHAGFVYGVGFSSDGQHLVTAGADGTVRFWDGTAGERYAEEVASPGTDMVQVAFSRDGRRLAWTYGSKSGAGGAGVRDVLSGQTVFSHQETRDGFLGLAFSPDGRFLAIGTGEPTRSAGSIRIWDLSTGQLTRTLDEPGGRVGQVIYTHDGQRLISSSLSGLLTVWDTESGARLQTLRGHRLGIFAVVVSPDGKLLVSGGGKIRTYGGELKLWDLTTYQERPWPHAVPDGITGLAFSPDGSRLAVAGFTEEARVWDMARAEIVLKLGHPRMATAVAYSPDGRRLATGSFDGTITIWEARTGQALLTLPAHTMPVTDLVFSPDGFRLASAGGEGKIKLWTASPQPVR